MDFNINPIVMLGLPVLLFAIVVHEVAHAVVAYWGGDDTASLQGRITLDPMSHIDPVGTVLLPIIGMFTGLPLIGWAKPVPVDTTRLKNSTWDVYVSIAGPISNVLQAALAVVLLFVMHLIFPDVIPFGFGGGEGFTIPGGIMTMLFWGIVTNLVLAVFNMIPLPPLDGHWVAAHFFLRPGNWLDQFYTAVQPINYIVLIGVILVLGRIGVFESIFGVGIFALNAIFN